MLVTVGASQVLQVTASLSGAIPYWQAGDVSVVALAVVLPLQLLGARIGVGIAHAVDPRMAKKAVAVLGVLAGAGVLVLAAAH